MNTRAFGFEDLTRQESTDIDGGALPIAGVAVAVALAGIFIAAFSAGYQAGAAAAQE